MSSSAGRRGVVGWVLYDWANSAYALTVLAAFFPVFFKKFWCAGYESSFSTIRLNAGNAIAGFLIAAASPFLGAFADAGGNRKTFLFVFMLLGVGMTAAFPLVGQGQWVWAIGLFVLANIGFSSANLFYDSLLPSVAPGNKLHIISSIGYAVGYLGCALLFILNIVMVQNPQAFGLSDTVAATKASFLTVSVWWFVFSLPLFFWVRENIAAKANRADTVVKRGLSQLKTTFRDIRSRKPLLLFLIAYWLYIDGVHTFIRSAADLGLSIGLDSGSLMVALLLVQLTAFPAAYVFGLVAQRIGAHRSLLIGVGMYLFVALVGPIVVRTELHYTVFAIIQALPLGALQALSRSYFARIIPADKAAEYFGFYNLVGKFAVMSGPALVAVVASVVRAFGGDSALAARMGSASLSLFFIAGAILLVFARRAEAREN